MATKARVIAGRAGVSLGAIGYPFGSTEALLHEALAEAVRRWLGPLIGLMSNVPERVERDRLGPTVESFWRRSRRGGNERATLDQRLAA